MVVEFLYLLLWWECALQLPLQGGKLLAVTEEHGMRRLAVASGTPGFLIVLFQGVWRIQVYYQPDVGLVYAHAEGVGGNHDADSAFLPVSLAEILLKVGQSCVEEGYGVSFHAKRGGNIFGLLSAVGIYYGTAWIQVQDMVQSIFVCGSVVQGIVQVGTGETHAEHVLLAKSEFLLYVIYYFGGGSGC